MDSLLTICTQAKAGREVALPSICSAIPDVLRACLLLAKLHNQAIVIEATSNQVNQFGGYVGQAPRQYMDFLRQLIAEVGIEPQLVTFGGDHLGPQVWRNQPAQQAMALAEELVGLYVSAGFSKIHLDCSQGCAGESEQVPLQLGAERAAQLAAVCEQQAGTQPAPIHYIIGTEVPAPGGARPGDHDIVPTTPAHVTAVVNQHQQTFAQLGLASAWSRVIGLVVQPGLEFAGSKIHHFDCNSKDLLSGALANFPRLIFEAHSTDFQNAAVFPELARRNFAILKVGPALSFAYREAIYALSHLDTWLSGADHISRLMAAVMDSKPEFWQGFYDPTAPDFTVIRHFAYTDRIRYYWPRVIDQLDELCSRIDQSSPTPQLLSQYLPDRVVDLMPVFAGYSLSRQIIYAWVASALQPYFFAAEPISK